MTEFEANISVGDGQAYFQILEDGSGLYNAKLLSYTGTSDKLTIKDVTLIRGIRDWAGSSDNVELHYLLGKAIEARMQKISI